MREKLLFHDNLLMMRSKNLAAAVALARTGALDRKMIHLGRLCGAAMGGANPRQGSGFYGMIFFFGEPVAQPSSDAIQAREAMAGWDAPSPYYR